MSRTKVKSRRVTNILGKFLSGCLPTVAVVRTTNWSEASQLTHIIFYLKRLAVSAQGRFADCHHLNSTVLYYAGC